MAILHDKNGDAHTVFCRHLVGRSRRANLRLDASDISAEHAIVVWTGDRWAVRDLGSRNGTRVNGVPVPAGTDRLLSRGDTLDFGAGLHTATLTSDEAPSTSATCGETVIVGENDLLAIPSVDDPLALIERDADGRWLMTCGALHTHVVDGQTLGIDDKDWKLSLPETLQKTATLTVVQHTVQDLSFRFNVSADEEYVQLTITTPTETMTLPARSHHYTLLVLARERMTDTEITDSEQGWLYKADLERMLRLSRNHINLGIHRVRRELAGLGIADPENIVENRLSTRQIRFGTSAVSESAI